jgi:hypothetical protein
MDSDDTPGYWVLLNPNSSWVNTLLSRANTNRESSPVALQLSAPFVTELGVVVVGVAGFGGVVVGGVGFNAPGASKKTARLLGAARALMALAPQA